jgi:hypothetical protein
MNFPRFNAEASLYKTSGRYQTNRNLINLPTQMGSAIYPAEVIEVHGCRPGLLQLGEGDDMVCIDPSDPFPGSDGGDGPGIGGPGGGPTGGGTAPPKRPPHRPRPPRPHEPHGKFTAEYGNSCSAAQLDTGLGTACSEQGNSDLLHNRPIRHQTICEPDNAFGTGKIWCCRVKNSNNTILGCYSE